MCGISPLILAWTTAFVPYGIKFAHVYSKIGNLIWNFCYIGCSRKFDLYCQNNSFLFTTFTTRSELSSNILTMA